jgi:hypothetical protein
MATILRKNTSLAYVLIFGAVLTIFCAYGYIQNRKMHNDLRSRLKSDTDIISIVGKFESFELVSSESDCVNIGSCPTSTHYYKVAGEKKCIAVEVVLYENFPNYYVKSVVPAYHFINNERHFVECNSPNLNR